jgi:hypothetical protein
MITVLLIVLYILGIIATFIGTMYWFHKDPNNYNDDESNTMFAALIALFWPLMLPIFGVVWLVFLCGRQTIRMFERMERQPDPVVVDDRD